MHKKRGATPAERQRVKECNYQQEMAGYGIFAHSCLLAGRSVKETEKH
jgi:hypothetical protein